jgi:hypothetical protein
MLRSNSARCGEAIEIHLDVQQIAALWGVDKKVVTREFREEPGVLRIQGTSRETLRIPISVVERVHRRLEGP